jgi:glucose/arabinose dehydrogenase
MRNPKRSLSRLLTAIFLAASSLGWPGTSAPSAAEMTPSMVDPNLMVRAVVTGLTTPTTMAFLGDNDFLVLEKNTGKVQHVVNGRIVGTALKLPVNFFSERGALGVALHPDFPSNPRVFIYWSESLSGTVSGDPADVLLLGNRVDRFVWDGTKLIFEKNLIRLRAFQADPPGQPIRGNHDGGVMVFEPRRGDGDSSSNTDKDKDKGKAKLLILVGDLGRRGQLQNLAMGPWEPPRPDDPFGGPQPDNAHLSGAILRINDDGTVPEDNPFFEAGEETRGEPGANIQRLFAYGIRNSFGMRFDPKAGGLWIEENGDDSFDKISRVGAGANNGWIQTMGPPSRVKDYKEIESRRISPPSLQQARWPASRIADTPEEALARLVILPGAHYNEPKFSWKFAVPPAAVGFINGPGLGPQYDGDFVTGAATFRTEGGHLFRFKLTQDRQDIDLDASGLAGRVAENNAKHDITGSSSLLFGRNFGIGTDIQTGPNGNLFVVSLTQGAVYEISRRT